MKHIRQLIQDKMGLGIKPLESIEAHLEGAGQWLLRAQRGTPDDGLAHSYDIRTGTWQASYPETTGYAIPTLYDYASHYHAPEYAAAAHKMALWECAIQLPDGGVRAGTMDADIIAPTIFNTGQALFGWARAYLETGDERFAAALRRAADWLLAAQDEDGAWRRFASPFTSSKLNSYNTRTAFGLVRTFHALQDARYLNAAIANVDWTVRRAQPNDWLPDNCLARNPDLTALTHTIAYSIRGILEVGAAAHRPDLIERALSMAKRVAAGQRADGALPGYYTPEWQSRVKWSCVTGNSQMAINWLRLARLTGESALIEHARRANRFNMSVQDLACADPNVRGGIKGSHPINGDYMTYRYPNWAAKFFMDGLMLEQLHAKIDNIG
jgi:hypothetical protein